MVEEEEEGVIEDKGEEEGEREEGGVEGGEGGRKPKLVIDTSNPHESRVLNLMELWIKFTKICKILPRSDKT